MIVHEVFAMIYEGEVKNIMVCDNAPTANYLARCVYGDDAVAIDCLQYACSVGDKYHDGFFWRVDPETGEKTQIPYTPTEKQQIEALKIENNELTMAVAELIGGGVIA